MILSSDGWKLLAAAVLGSLAAMTWFAFLRRVPEETALATVVNKEHQAGGSYIQQPVEVNRSFRMPREIPIAESYMFELRLEGATDPVRASFNSVKSRHFAVGQQVRVKYVRRGIPPFWQRITVVDMTTIESH